MTSAYILHLQAHAAAQAQAGREERDRGAALVEQAARERLVPLDARLTRLLATIPEAVQKDGLSLPALQASLRGRWRGNCHPGELGRALAKAGFVRTRDWRSVNGFRAIWRKVG
jgi:hypothetical protein